MTNVTPSHRLMPPRHGACHGVFPAMACGQRAHHTRRYVSTVIAWMHFSDLCGMQRLRSQALRSARQRSAKPGTR